MVPRSGSRTRGFTLIELLVVIAIIAILAAILFPVFARARENARRASCQSNLKQIALSFHQYSQDYDERLPLVAWAVAATGDYPSGTGGTSYSPTAGGPKGGWLGPWNTEVTCWIDEIMPYLKSTQILNCPSDPLPQLGAGAGYGVYGAISYGMNGGMHGFSYYSFSQQYPCMWADTGYAAFRYWNAYGTTAQGSPNKIPIGQHMAKIVNPATKILLADIVKNKAIAPYYGSVELYPAPNDYAASYYHYPPATDDHYDTATTWGNFNTTTYPTGAATGRGRHLGGANVAFADGHVKWLPARTPGFFFYDVGSPFPECPSGSYYCGSREAIKLWVPYADVT